MTTQHTHTGKISIDKKLWGEADGQPVWLYTISLDGRFTMCVTNYGAIVQALRIRHADGMRDVVLGYDSLNEYIADPFYIGCVVGRFANRIDGSIITLDGKDYNITTTPGGFHHHGGKKGFGKQVWQAAPFTETDCAGIVLSYTSKHLEEGFPGNLHVKVRYEINIQTQWSITYEVSTDQTTIHNVTQHAYFNLSGHNHSNILNHRFETSAQHILLANQRQIPTGEFLELNGSPFDFSSPKTIGKDIDSEHDQLRAARGYDHYFVLEKERTNTLKRAGSAGDDSGLQMTFYTTEPGFHFYTGNYLEPFKGKENRTCGLRSGFCIETHNFPDAPNHSHFPSAIIRPGFTYESRTIFQFTTR